MKAVWRHRFRPTTLWLFAFLGLLGGLGISHFRTFDYGLLIWPLVTAIFVCLRQRSWPALFLVTVLAVLCGWWRGDVYMNRLEKYDVLYTRQISFAAIVSGDAAYGKTKQLEFDVGHVVLDDGSELPGHLQVSGFGVNAINQGDEVEVSGKLYPGYGAYQGSVKFAHIEVLAHHNNSITELRRRFVAGMQSALPEPLAPFAMGLLVGQRATLPQSVKDDLKHVGLTHIIAVSGANLTIILRASQRLIGKRSKRMSTFLTIGLIGIFLALAGSSASIVRAAIVSMLSIAAGYYGRSFKPLNLICLAAVITAWANPTYIWNDLGWYLSFLAFFGVMILAPLIQARWPGRWHNSIIGAVALESICAEVMTLPFVLHIFGQMSRVGLLANVLVVAFIPLSMLLGLFAGLAGMFCSSIAGWFAWPATILLNYMLDTAHLLASLPSAFMQNINLSLLQMLILYACILSIIAVLWFKNDGKSAIITDRNDSKTRGLLT